MPAQVAVVDTRTFEYELVRIGPLLDTTTIAGHQWTSRNGRFTFAAYEGGTSPGVAVIEHKQGSAVIGTLDYPGRPHGVDLVPGSNDDEGHRGRGGRLTRPRAGGSGARAISSRPGPRRRSR